TITVAAGGALLGTTVQATATKERVADANDRAEQAESSARQSFANAAKAEAAKHLLENLEPPGNPDAEADRSAIVAQLRAVLS
ncbi:hypothetical protein LTR94_030894, partial [Friedmanniomyces endolithicus]